jgi:hypothetical protein
MWSAKAHEAEKMFSCEAHCHKWGKMQGMKPNDSQVHSHFGSCICVGVVNVQNLGWKGKQAPNWAPRIPLKICWNVDV